MEENTVSIVISVVALLIALYTFYQLRTRKLPSNMPGNSSLPLQLQAYERLVMLSERIALPNLISRNYQHQYSAKEMQMLLIDNIKQEFEYNASQQIYVSASAWEAIRNLRDQNMLIINKVGINLSAEATAADLNKQLLDVIMHQKEKPLHIVVSDTINSEAKKIME